MTKINIVCLSTQLWEDPMWTNKQHVMTRLAKRGHKILYVEPLIRVRKFLKHVFLGRYTLKRLFTFVKQVDRNLYLFSPVRFLFSESKETNFFLKRIRSLIDRLFTEKPILWVYDPEFADFVEKLPHQLVIYDCVDDYSQFPESRYPKGKKWVLEKEAKLIKKADLVFATSKNLYEKRRTLNPKTYYTPNVADFEHNRKALEVATRLPEDIKNIPPPIIGFQGALASYKVNLSLLEKLAQRHPEWSLVLIGPKAPVDPKTDLTALKKLRNVYFLGVKPYKDLPNYYKAMAVAIIPYNINEYTKSSFPLKFFEYLGAGLLIVTTDLPSLSDYKDKDVAYFAKDDDDFIKGVKEVLAKNPKVGLKKRLAIAQENSWEGKVDKLLEIIYKHL